MLERYNPEPLHCKVGRQVPSLVVLYSSLSARYIFTIGLTERVRRETWMRMSGT